MQAAGIARVWRASGGAAGDLQSSIFGRDGGRSAPLAERARMMADIAQVLICAADAVADGGKGVRFPVSAGGEASTGFVVRHGGKAYGLNCCA
jgi:hypothetical protein